VGIKDYCFKKSLWVFHFGGASCNNCDIEILDCLTPRYDIERFGIQLVGSIKHADVLLVSGSITEMQERLLEVYHQAPKPIVVLPLAPADAAEVYLLMEILSMGRWIRSFPLTCIFPLSSETGSDHSQLPS
jgi:membrane-bound hydrogenase subunit mbhJ